MCYTQTMHRSVLRKSVTSYELKTFVMDSVQMTIQTKSVFKNLGWHEDPFYSIEPANG
jgi:hypothetical protein